MIGMVGVCGRDVRFSTRPAAGALGRCVVGVLPAQQGGALVAIPSSGPCHGGPAPGGQPGCGCGPGGGLPSLRADVGVVTLVTAGPTTYAAVTHGPPAILAACPRGERNALDLPALGPAPCSPTSSSAPGFVLHAPPPGSRPPDPAHPAPATARRPASTRWRGPRGSGRHLDHHRSRPLHRVERRTVAGPPPGRMAGQPHHRPARPYSTWPTTHTVPPCPGGFYLRR
jgi:hypothetical protein